MTPSGRLWLLAAAAVVVLTATATPAGATGHDCGFPFNATDTTGTDVVVTDEPDRIVSLGPSASQTLWEVGAQDDVVGLTSNGYYLDGASDLPNVYDAGSFSYQTDEIVNLSPDLVLAPNIVFQPTVDQLRAANLTVYKFPAAAEIEDVEQKTRRIGRLTGHCFGAHRTNAWMMESIEAVEHRIAGTERPRVFYHLIGDVTAGSSTFVHDAIATARGENVAALAGITFYAEYSDDILIQHDPEWVLTAESTSVPDRPAFAATTAIERGQTLGIRDRYVSQPAPRVVYAVRRMARAFHPEAFERSGRPAPTNVTSRTRSAMNRTRTVNATDSSVTVRFDGTVNRAVDVEALSDPGADAPGTTVGAWRLMAAATAENRSVTVTFSVPRSRLEAIGASVGDIAAFRRHGSEWTRLRQVGRDSTEERVNITVETASLSVFTVAAVSPPRASFPAAEAVVETGRSVTFRADRSAPIHGRVVDYEWSTDGASGTGPAFTVTFDDPGRYDVMLTVRTAANLSDTVTRTVNVTSRQAMNESDVGHGSDDDRGQTGFGILVAVLGLLAVAFRRAGTW